MFYDGVVVTCVSADYVILSCLTKIGSNIYLVNVRRSTAILFFDRRKIKKRLLHCKFILQYFPKLYKKFHKNESMHRRTHQLISVQQTFLQHFSETSILLHNTPYYTQQTKFAII